MNDKQLLFFLEAARQLNFTKAAENLFTTQPTVTYQITQLEEDLGVPLFERANKRVFLTPAGEVLYKRGQELAALWRLTEEELKEAQSNLETLRIGHYDADGDVYFMDVITVFSKQHPEFKLKLSFPHANDIPNMLLREELHTAITYEFPSEIEGLDYLTLYEHQEYCILSDTHSLANQAMLSFTDLEEEVLILNLDPMPLSPPQNSQMEPLMKCVLTHMDKGLVYPSPTMKSGLYDACLKKGILLVPSFLKYLPKGLVQIPLSTGADHKTALL